MDDRAMDPAVATNLVDSNEWLVGDLTEETIPLLGQAAEKDPPISTAQNLPQAMVTPDDQQNKGKLPLQYKTSADDDKLPENEGWLLDGDLAEDGFPQLATTETFHSPSSHTLKSAHQPPTNYSPQRPTPREHDSSVHLNQEEDNDWVVGDLAEDGFPHLATSHNEILQKPVRPPRHPTSAAPSNITKQLPQEFVVSRKKTVVEREFQRRQTAAKEYIDQFPPDITVQHYLPTGLQGALFCGHVMTDLDSIAGSIGAAELYGGVAARASEINPETAFVLELWGVEAPRPIEELLVEYPQAGVCLVDHQQMSQLNKAIDVSRIVGVIDHHALQNATIITEMPIYIDIRPWGSMSSIITHIFMTLRRRPRKATAGVMLCAILSDTLNLQSPTTTEWDRLMVAVLVQLAEIEDVQSLASQQFKAKSCELAGLSCEALIAGDQKVFTYKTADFDGSIAFAVVETTDDEVILSKKESLIEALREDKDEKGYSLTFLAIVNIVDLHSTLLLCGPNERSLATKAFPDAQLIIENYKDADMMDLGNLVSRKKDFIPAISTAVKKGWSNAPRGSIHASPSDIFDFAKYRDTSLTMSKVH